FRSAENEKENEVTGQEQVPIGALSIDSPPRKWKSFESLSKRRTHKSTEREKENEVTGQVTGQVTNHEVTGREQVFQMSVEAPVIRKRKMVITSAFKKLDEFHDADEDEEPLPRWENP